MHHEHLTAETVADHLEGLLGPGEAAEAERHLAQCPGCSAMREDLGRLRAALASHSTVPMPASVAARIDLALAEAAGPRTAAGLSAGGKGASGQEQTAEQPVRSPAGGLIGGRRAGSTPRRRWVPALGAALATIAIVAGAVAVLPRLGGSHNESGQLATAGEGGQTGSAGGAKAEDTSPEPNAPANGSASATSANVVRSGRAYTAYTLSAGVRDLLAQQDTALSYTARQPDAAARPASPAPSDGAIASSLSLSRLENQTALTACIQSMVKGEVAPIVVDFATYGGEPAAIIVLPDPADSTSANVYVVSPDCGPGGSTPIATTTVRRPVTAAPSPNTPSGTQSTPATPPSP